MQTATLPRAGPPLLSLPCCAVLLLAGAVVTQAVLADPKKRVVITGMGVASCFGNDVETYYNQLLEGVSAVGAIDRWGLGYSGWAYSPCWVQRLLSAR